MIELIIAAAFLQAADPCNAVGAAAPALRCPSWRSVGQDTESELFVDPASLRRDGGTFDIATRIVFGAAQQGGMRSGVVTARFDCARRTWAFLHSAYFDARGVVIVEGDSTGTEAAPQAVAEGGPIAGLLTEFCPRRG
jgi:hypothetical protein